MFKVLTMSDLVVKEEFSFIFQVRRPMKESNTNKGETGGEEDNPY
jgi:hypothetical protein